MITEELVKRAIVRLNSTKQGQFAREEIEEGMSLREVIHSYDLEISDVDALRVIRQWLREHDELPETSDE